ncbi:17625_t:CDS:2 [Cetraspora pellucida]|uniref:17625_t:CDS:1 n=1 Tax=Cetraspora pellucida TaxID=1433469 RepID=A0A9N9EBI5_9GLOM|nr:17625_t:CDS:2 [Cetraspora pellucida]
MSNWFKVAIEQKYITSFEYDSFQNWEEIGRGGSGTIYGAYSRDIEKTIALKSLYCDDNISLNGFIKEIKNITRVAHHDNIVRFFGITQGITLQVINGKRETPVNGTPIDFMNIYCDAWNGDPTLRPSIAEIRDKLNYIQM